MKFFVSNCSCLQNRWLGGYAPKSPFSLFSVLNRICWTPPPKIIPGYATVNMHSASAILYSLVRPVWLYQISSQYLKKRQDLVLQVFGKSVCLLFYYISPTRFTDYRQVEDWTSNVSTIIRSFIIYQNSKQLHRQYFISW